MDNIIYSTIKYIAEAYLSSVEQLANTITADDKDTQKQSKLNMEYQAYTMLVFGSGLYKKYENLGQMGTYPPVAVSALNLNYADFRLIFKKWIADDETQIKYTDKIIAVLKKEYSKFGFSVGYDGMIMSNVVFKTFDEICHFIGLIYKTVNKLCKDAPGDILNWKPLCNKYKGFLK